MGGHAGEQVEQHLLRHRLLREIVADGKLTDEQQPVVDFAFDQRGVRETVVTLEEASPPRGAFAVGVAVHDVSVAPGEKIGLFQPGERRVGQVFGEADAPGIAGGLEVSGQAAEGQRIGLIENQHLAPLRGEGHP